MNERRDDMIVETPRREESTPIGEAGLETLYHICRLSGRRFSHLIDDYARRGRLDIKRLGPRIRDYYYRSRAAQGGLTVCPVSLAEANEFVARHHRHHLPVTGHKFSVGVMDSLELRGVAIVGRPVARALDDGWVLEVTRLCTDSVPNGVSLLSGAVRRAAQALGYRRLVSYTLRCESGDSMRAAGWSLVGEAGGGSWDRPSRPRSDRHPTVVKLLWEMMLI